MLGASAVATIAGILIWGAVTVAAPTSNKFSWTRLVAHPGTISLNVAYPTVGETEQLIARGLPPSTAVSLVWQTVQGRWKVDGPTFIGAKYRYGTATLGHGVSGSHGSLRLRFSIPQGFGGTHLLGLQVASGTLAAEGSVTVVPSVTLRSSQVPQGGFFQFTMTGVGYQPYFALFPVTYDNHLTGNVTAVSTRGTAHFAVRAEGVGLHEISVNNGVMGGPYLNEQQSPFPYMPTFSFPVTVLPETPHNTTDKLPTLQPAPVGKFVANPASGVVGSTFTLTGHGLKSHQHYQVTWWTVKGSHVSGQGYATEAIPFGLVTPNAHGAFKVIDTVPSDLGGPPHRITLSLGQHVIAATTFRIFPKVETVAPDPAPQGSLVTITILGGGWTDYDNIYSVDYDNSFVGFGCAFNSQGNLQIQLRATGKPGLHFIDIYPSVWKGTQSLPNYYLVPQLTYNADHPGDWLPAFHVVLRVTAPRQAGSHPRLPS
ncbi:MAG: hypothetical protein C7B45_01105 [Sulfobacillus acidophilus]|uniref:Uncharacterized protein n=1 Tax=Sulfobacillus acidophilus TaxID=53633 RepID=A0A2T2WNX9_9FIRM|nr:MAG: hypothetical protein C7B45_01105 [Sulfobacillus acidophilus]